MAEMYSTNNAVIYKLHVIIQTVNTINCNDYMLRLRLSVMIEKNLLLFHGWHHLRSSDALASFNLRCSVIFARVGSRLKLV